jgi:hypothetical protein
MAGRSDIETMVVKLANENYSLMDTVRRLTTLTHDLGTLLTSVGYPPINEIGDLPTPDTRMGRTLMGITILLLDKGKYINAIRYMRKQYPLLPLKESKEIVDKIKAVLTTVIIEMENF